ncbi:MAG: DUF4965 domain-containing protein [Lentisphaerae bacterium]|jgi:hypothetical protein|nr:DUF4965 domain-containing protein [Lentisphaerota bacterium]
MARVDRLPSVPLIASDPYFSIWMPADTMTQTDSTHWSGPVKALRGTMTVDGKAHRFLGAGAAPEARQTSLVVTPTSTMYAVEADGVRLDVRFTTPALPDDLDLLSMPVTLVSFTLTAIDGQAHDTRLSLHLSDRLCYDGEIRPRMNGFTIELDGLHTGWYGQMAQKPLCHSGDHITIDWGYLYLASRGAVAAVGDGLVMDWSGTLQGEQQLRAIIAYDDIASINYFGDLCKAWYRRNGAQITDAIRTADSRFDEIIRRCDALDERVLGDAAAIGADYQQIVSAAWRQTFCAHKLIATPAGEMALLSKENDSNGCIGTVDVSYPSIPIFLKYCPELVNALCRPILAFASMPVWTDDFAPHDVGRYPLAIGQVYAANSRTAVKNGDAYPPFYLFPAGTEVYSLKYQMPVEECGNMLIMLAAAQQYGADKTLATRYRGLLDKWVKYLVDYGEDPGEQLCTDDFAGHLAHNANLAAKAICGVACYGRLVGDNAWLVQARGMAKRFLDKVGCNGGTPLTLDGAGWSMKYNLLWDRVLALDLLPARFYEAETRSYLLRLNRYGLPLDSRADYTKSDWLCWTAALADDLEVRTALLAPLAKMLRESASRVAFSDWYDTKTGCYRAFIARSVQGGVFAPLLR